MSALRSTQPAVVCVEGGNVEASHLYTTTKPVGEAPGFKLGGLLEALKWNPDPPRVDQMRTVDSG